MELAEQNGVIVGANFIEEYLVKLGGVVDQTSFRHFHQALRDASAAVDVAAADMSEVLLNAGTAIAAGFAAAGSAIVGMSDKVAMADQQYRLFGLHMFMSRDAARGLKVAMDALDEPLENLAWDPELRGRTIQLLKDQAQMRVGGGFEQQMHRIRDIRFQFTRMHVELEYLAMHVVSDFMTALGLGPTKLLKTLQHINNWVIHNMPQISKKLVQDFMPIWHSMVGVLKSVWELLKSVGVAYTNVIGALTGDYSLMGTTASFHKFADALQITVALIDQLVVSASKGIIDLVLLGKSAVDAVNILASLSNGESPSKGWQQLKNDFGQMQNPFTIDPSVKKIVDQAMGGRSNKNFESLVTALAYVESGSQGMAARSDKGAIGTMQLMKGTAQQYGVNPYSAAGNLKGGSEYIRDLLKHYHGNVAEAVGAYNAGPGRMDAFLAGKATLPLESQHEIARVLGAMGRKGSVEVGSITIHIQRPNASPEEIASAVQRGLQRAGNQRIQRNLAEFNHMGYSY